ncbi:hypothetical protein SAMD00019534_018940, partial [Acytostelium subglobosum LB1]|uniref:hypothetical protein n=1 Tax=Acytostelium subglobosum LB1 TaxID=1410327 RepID=UPI000644F40C
MARGIETEVKVERLDLAYRNMTEINPQIVERFGSSVKELDLSSNHLDKDLSILEGFKRLHTLVLDDNRMTQHTKLPQLHNLNTLWVNSNMITNLSVFIDRVAEAMPNLKTLSMLKNEACPNFFNGHSLREYRDYRLYVVHRLKGLTLLDTSPVTDEERSDSAKVYSTMTNVLNPHATVPAKAKVEVEDDPKKKRIEHIKEEEQRKLRSKQERLERRENRKIRREQRAAKQLELEKQQIQAEKEKAKKEDDFTDSEDEGGDKPAKSGKPGKLPIFATNQAPMAIIPPQPTRANITDDADDEDGGNNSDSDQSDLPIHRSSQAPLHPPAPPTHQVAGVQAAHDDLEDDDDTTTSEWSSDVELRDDDDEQQQYINSALPTKLTLQDQYYDDDDSSEEEYMDDEYEITHYPVVRRPTPPH